MVSLFPRTRLGRKVAALAAGIALLGVLVTAARAHHTFTDTAGFDSYPVTISPEWADDVEVWNRLAGRDLIVPGDTPDIHVVSGEVTWVQVAYPGPWTSCTVHLKPGDEHFLSHEVGHCLGLADHVYGTSDRHVNAADCWEHPYRGLMAYCGGLNDHDIAAVRDATGGTYRRTVAIVSGTSWPDALAASQLDADLLYVGGLLDAATRDALWAYDRAIIVGGPAVVSEHLESEVADVLPTTRIFGPNRYATAREVAARNELEATR